MKKLTTSQTLQLGIEATRGGLPGVARGHFTAILKQEPDNIPALLWLAYITLDPHHSLHLLNQVLTIDPNNERAKSGIHWAKKRLQKDTAKPVINKDSQQAKLVQNVPTTTGKPPRKRQPARLVPQKINKRSWLLQPGYAFKILLAIVIMGILGLAIGLGASMFIPAETLAAWLPAPTPSPDLVFSVTVPSTQPTQSVEIPQASIAKNFTSASDTITLASLPSVEVEVFERARPAQTVFAVDSLPQLIPDGENLLLTEATLTVPTKPPLLIGPASPVDPTPVDPSQLAHQPAYPGEKWIEVNVTTQEVTAWEGNVPVISFISSTGLPNTPTVLGEYNIYWKLEKTLMTGPGYYLPDVPYTMYFYQGYALHGTYWHDNFGQQMSRGCVNLSIDNSKKLFEWADPVIPPGQTDVWASTDNPGTLVVVHR